MHIVPSDRFIFEVFKQKCLMRETFKKVAKRDTIYIIQNGKIQYKYNSVKKHKYENKVASSVIAVLNKTVKKSYIDYAIKNKCDIYIPKQNGSVRSTNTHVYNSLPKGELFYEVDICHAYWQVAYKIGMIDEKTYNKYADNAKIKRFRNMSLTAVLAPKTVEYINKGRYCGRITEDTGIFNKIYTKIRRTCYNVLYDVLSEVNTNWIKYNIDGLAVLPDMLPIVERKLKQFGYKYTISECHKIDDKTYSSDGEIKNFKIKSRIKD